MEGYNSSYLVISQDKSERQKDRPWAQKSYTEEKTFNLSRNGSDLGGDMGETSKFELASRKTTGQVKNSMGLGFLVNQRLNCPAGFRAMGQSL